MIGFFSALHRRNRLLSIFGWLCLAGFLVCMTLHDVDTRFVVGVNLWLKPIKFFISVAIFTFSMAWYLHYLDRPKLVRAYSRMLVIVMSFELAVITWQAAHQRISHYNTDTPLYAALFMLMGIAIGLLTIWTAYIGYLFFKRKKFDLPMSYVWGIRLGILIFVIFASEGGLMVSHMAHTVGGADGSPGVPFFNWSRYFGDLRVAHFFGLHALQILPLIGWYSTRSVRAVWVFAGLYLGLATVVLIQALLAIPFI